MRTELKINGNKQQLLSTPQKKKKKHTISSVERQKYELKLVISFLSD